MASKAKRPVNSAAAGIAGGAGAQSHQTVETEIERARETENWDRVLELAEALRAKADKNFGVLADFLVGESKLEGYLKKSSQSTAVSDAPEIVDAKQALLRTVGEDAKRLGVHLDSYILLGKLHYSLGDCAEALRYYERSRLDTLEEKALPPRSLKIMAEAFAIKGMCMEKTKNAAALNKAQTQEVDQQIIQCYEVASDLTLLFLQVADRTASFGQSTWSVGSVGTSGSTSPASAEDFRPKTGSILESSLYKAAALNINQNKPLKAITRLRNMLMAEESESLKEIRRNVTCQLAEVLISNCSGSKYIRPDLDVTVPKRASSRSGGAAAEENPWKPMKQSGTSLFTPRNKDEELILILLLSENIANKGAVLSQGPGSAVGRKATYDAATVTYDLLTLTLSHFNSYKLLCDMLERSMKFSFQERHTWQQFAYVLSSEGRYFRSLLVLRDMAERLTMDAGSCMSAARICFEKLHLYEEGIEWARKALETRTAKSNKYLEARCLVYVGIGHMLASDNIENLKGKRERMDRAGESFALARLKDDRDHLVEFHLAYFYAQTRQVKKASHHVRNALNYNPFHFPSLHLMILLLTSNKEFDEALKLAEHALEEFPDHLELHTLKIKLEEFVFGAEEALRSAKEMMQRWQSIVEEMGQKEDPHQENLSHLGQQNFGNVAGSAYAISQSGRESSASALPTGMLTNSGMDGFRSGPFDAYSDRDSVSYQASHTSVADRTFSEVGSSRSAGQFPQRPNPKDPSYSLMRIWVLLAEIHLGQGDLFSAELCANEAKQLAPYSYHVTHIRGLIEEAKGNYEETRQLFENALAVNPQGSASLFHLARTYFHLKHYRLAIDSIQIALGSDPYSEDLWSLLGRVYETLSMEIMEESELFDMQGGSDGDRDGPVPPADASTSSSTESLDQATTGEPMGQSASNDGGESFVRCESTHIPTGTVVSMMQKSELQNGSSTRLRDESAVISSAMTDSTMFYYVPNLRLNHDDLRQKSKGENIDSLANEAAKKAAKAAECLAVALALHNTGPIVPFATIAIAYD